MTNITKQLSSISSETGCVTKNKGPKTTNIMGGKGNGRTKVGEF